MPESPMPALQMVRDPVDLLRAVRAFRASGETIALVPTMGALHEGHLELVRQGRDRASRVVATIFVNPTQFGPQEDFSTYPRDEAGDMEKLSSAGADLVYLPHHHAIYPAGFSTGILPGRIAERLCGVFRPGHFSAVATVVTKLLLQSQPDIALFGEKDYQQLLVIRRVVRDLDIGVTILGVETMREADGLAMSSRNRYLSPSERRSAAHLPACLNLTAHALQRGGNPATLLAEAIAQLQKAGFSPVQYLELVDALTLEPANDTTGEARLMVAACLGRTRLIDNIPVSLKLLT